MVSINYFSNYNNPNSNPNSNPNVLTDPYNKAKQQEGIPLDKLLFSTDVVTPSSEAEKVEEIVNAYTSSNPQVKAAMNDSMMPVALRTLKEYTDSGGNLGNVNSGNKVSRQKAYHVITSIMQANRKMIIGKALSFARPGEP